MILIGRVVRARATPTTMLDEFLLNDVLPPALQVVVDTKLSVGEKV